MEKSKNIFFRHLFKDDKLDFLKLFYYTYLYQDIDVKQICQHVDKDIEKKFSYMEINIQKPIRGILNECISVNMYLIMLINIIK